MSPIEVLYPEEKVREMMLGAAEYAVGMAHAMTSMSWFFRWCADQDFLFDVAETALRKGFNDGLRAGCHLRPEEVPALIDKRVEAFPLSLSIGPPT